ncbi:hypothetical protein K435DRAFT_74069 [Dendrothele bispora CBS 962.96]|uniref:Uncharacterized protein n=1 Tax=Dendrothele bispora (strain CBS 962.96) TaxID=1314807 RepID=A0A4V4HG16_DENBC|nr:hypothetical protein K435DRAFT_74069 [Dendrothele bispora CBS 962.96]
MACILPPSGQITHLIPLAQPDTIVLPAVIQHPLSNVDLDSETRRENARSTRCFFQFSTLNSFRVDPIHQQTKTPQTPIGIHSSSPHYPLKSIPPLLALLYLYLQEASSILLLSAFIGVRMIRNDDRCE